MNNISSNKGRIFSNWDKHANLDYRTYCNVHTNSIRFILSPKKVNYFVDNIQRREVRIV